MWDTTAWRSHTDDLQCFQSFFDHCQYGGKRQKETQLRHNIKSFLGLNLLCPGESAAHRHLPWGRVSKYKFATSEETAYPLPLCRHMAHLLSEELQALGYASLPRSLPEAQPNPHHSAQVFLGSQPRSKKVPPMVPEFKTVIAIDSAEPFLVGQTKLQTQVILPAQVSADPPIESLPAGTRVLRRLQLGVGGSAARCQNEQESTQHPRLSQPNSREECQASQPPTHPAERHARACLCSPVITEDDVGKLFELLEPEKAARGGGHENEFSWTTGAYRHGGILGTRQHARAFPWVTKMLCSFVRRRSPGHPFTTLLLGRNLKGKVHTDRNNSKAWPNCIHKLSDFKGGLWIQHDQGPIPCPDPDMRQLMGKILDFEDNRMILDPHVAHCVAPWTGGDRDILVAFTVGNDDKIPNGLRCELEDLGFSLPCPLPSSDPSGLGRDNSPPAGPERVESPRDSLRVHRTVVGIPWTADEFISKALSAGHPRGMVLGLPNLETLSTDYPRPPYMT